MEFKRVLQTLSCFYFVVMFVLKNVAIVNSIPHVVEQINANLLDSEGKVKQLLERGETVTAALQLLENVASGKRHYPCKKTSLTEIDNTAFEWKHLVNPAQIEKQMETTIKSANILNNYFLQTQNDSFNDPLFLYALVKSNVESDPTIFSSSIVLVEDDRSYFIPTAVRTKDGSVETKEGNELIEERWPGNEWFWKLSDTNFTTFIAQSLNSSFDFIIKSEDGVWTAPYFDCVLTMTWHVTFGVPFFTHHENEIIFRGAASISMPISNFDINQCESRTHQSPFSSTHHCDTRTTECVTRRGAGFRRGSYRCYCKPNYFFTDQMQEYQKSDRFNYFDGEHLEEVYTAIVLGQSDKKLEQFSCLPCRSGCDTCIGNDVCYVEYNMLLRSLILCFQSFCSTIAFILAVVIFRLRKSKIISNAMWIMLETILFGALLLYHTVIIRYFEPTVFTCMLEPWFRGLGFAICYGAIILKIYRILAEFQTRKAHRVCVRDKDLLKYLFGIILVVIGYLLAWTAIVRDSMNEGYNLIVQEKTSMGLKYVMCRALWWDYVTEAGELLFLLFGVFLTYKVRNAKADCLYEKSSLAWSIYIEALVSMLMYFIRHVVWTNLHPDYVYLLYFLRCQCTVSINLFLIYSPKLWYYYRPPEPLEHQSRRQLSSCGETRDHLSETIKLHEAITSNGDVDFSEINLSEMDPDDIRTELRRVYTQLQILRNFTMKKGNPHISRRRGGRKGAHRRFSLQTFHHKHKHYHEYEHDGTDASKTPEESTASIDIPAPNSKDEYNTPTVTFKN